MLHVVHPRFSPRMLPAQVCIEIIAFGLQASRKIRMVKPTSQSSTTVGIIALNLHSRFQRLSYGHSRIPQYQSSTVAPLPPIQPTNQPHVSQEPEPHMQPIASDQ